MYTRPDMLQGPAAYLGSTGTGASSATCRAESLSGRRRAHPNPGYAAGSCSGSSITLVSLSGGRIL